MIDGDAKEQQRQRQARDRISEQIQGLAAELDTPSYEPSLYSVEEMCDRISETPGRDRSKEKQEISSDIEKRSTTHVRKQLKT